MFFRRTFLGVMLIIIGLLALLQSLGIQNFGLSFWPVVLTLLGIGMAASAIRHGVRWFQLGLGLWVGSIGLFNILHAAGYSMISGGLIARQGWPILLIGIGLGALFGKRFFTVKGDWNFGGKGEYRMVGDLRYGTGGRWTLEETLTLEHGVGDLKLDLTTAEIKEGLHRVHVKGGVGDVLVRVPDDVTVQVEGKVGIGELDVLGDRRSGLGITAHKRVEAPESTRELVIQAKLGIGNLRVVQMPAQTSRLVL